MSDDRKAKIEEELLQGAARIDDERRRRAQLLAEQEAQREAERRDEAARAASRARTRAEEQERRLDEARALAIAVTELAKKKRLPKHSFRKWVVYDQCDCKYYSTGGGYWGGNNDSAGDEVWISMPESGSWQINHTRIVATRSGTWEMCELRERSHDCSGSHRLLGGAHLVHLMPTLRAASEHLFTTVPDPEQS